MRCPLGPKPRCRERWWSGAEGSGAGEIEVEQALEEVLVGEVVAPAVGAEYGVVEALADVG